MTEDNRISAKSRDNFTVIPNLIDEMDLSVHAFRLYCHIRRRAGDSGSCFESTENLAKYCNMSTGKVSEAKKELVKAHLIFIKECQRLRGGIAVRYHDITVVDVWHANWAYYSYPEGSSELRRAIVNDKNERARIPQMIHIENSHGVV